MFNCLSAFLFRTIFIFSDDYFNAKLIGLIVPFTRTANFNPVALWLPVTNLSRVEKVKLAYTKILVFLGLFVLH